MGSEGRRSVTFPAAQRILQQLARQQTCWRGERRGRNSYQSRVHTHSSSRSTSTQSHVEQTHTVACRAIPLRAHPAACPRVRRRSYAARGSAPPPTGRAPWPPPVRGRVLHRHLERRCVVNAIQRPRRPRVVSCVVLRDINVFIGGSRPPHCMGTARGDTTKHVCEMLKSQVHAVHTCICATR